MEYHPDEGADIASWTSAFVGDRWNQYLQYWGLHAQRPEGLDERDWQLRRSLDQLGRSLGKAIHSLSVESDVVDAAQAVVHALSGEDAYDDGSLSPLELAHLAPHHPLVRDCLEFQVGMEASDVLLPTATQRVFVLLSLIARRSLSERAAAYLDRATRLYLWGFDPETVIMAHSVLEAATAEAVTDEQLERLGVKPRNKVFSSAQRAQGARSLGLLSDDDLARADAIRRARNDAVHLAPGVASDATTVVTDLALLLTKLLPKPAT